MKNISTYISEKLRISSAKQSHLYKPNDSDKLKDIIKDLIVERGLDADLNDIDTSMIYNMNALFQVLSDDTSGGFNGDISEWNVSNVTDMSYMFVKCKNFNSDLSKWDVSNVTDMSFMFQGCEKFNQDISEWNVSNVEYMMYMFDGCKKFNCDLSNWNVSNVKRKQNMFYRCKSLDHKPSWY